LLLLCLLQSFAAELRSQNSLTGDGFGGNLWYKPYNYGVGAYTAYTICGDSAQLYSWGFNGHAQLGDGSINAVTGAVKVPGMSDVHFYSSGYCTGVIKNDQSGWVWGTVGGPSPVKVIDSVRHLDAGTSVCVFVKTDGTVWSVGQNPDGSFGNGKIDAIKTLVPQQMIGISTAVRVSNSNFTTIVLLEDGTVTAVGTNSVGALGNNTANYDIYLNPVKVIGLKDIVDIKSDYLTNIALDKHGDVYAWGYYEGCGNPSSSSNFIPQKITGLKDIVAISGCNDGKFFMALDSAHNCYIWGYNGFKASQVPVIIATGVDDIYAAETFAYVAKSDGTLWGIGAPNPLGGSIWMNLSHDKRSNFEQLNPELLPMKLCKPVPRGPEKHTRLNIHLCKGDSFVLGNKTYRSESTHCDTMLSYKGHDSIIVTGIHFLATSAGTLDTAICAGEMLQVGTNKYMSSGIYHDTFVNHLGCDSVFTSKLTVWPVSGRMQVAAICSGEKFPAGKNLYASSGIYLDTFSNYLGCDSILTTNLTVHPKPIADFSYDPSSVITGDTVWFINLSTGAGNYIWHMGDPANDSSMKANPVFVFYLNGRYYVRLIAINPATACRDTVFREIDVKDNSDIFIPIAFTPNEDGLNDFFLPVSHNYDKLVMRIYNRWGELLFETTTFSGWDGKFKDLDCPQEVYLYAIEFTHTTGHKDKRFRGTFTLLR
jgi:gliding motility-associated-like protein